MKAGSGRRLEEEYRRVADAVAANQLREGGAARVVRSLMLGGPATLAEADRERARRDPKCWPSVLAAARLLTRVYGHPRAEARAKAARWLSGMRAALDSPDLPAPPAQSLVDAIAAVANPRVSRGGNSGSRGGRRAAGGAGPAAADDTWCRARSAHRDAHGNRGAAHRTPRIGVARIEGSLATLTGPWRPANGAPAPAAPETDQ